MKPKQQGIWTSEDTPLFSGVAVSVKEEIFDQKPEQKSTALDGFKCKLCFDTGMVAQHYCLCEAGLNLRREMEW